MTEKKIYYKVVTRSRRSSIVSAHKSKATVTYKVNKWVTPKENYGPLMVFDTLENAIAFSSSIDLIYKCEIKKSPVQYKFLTFFFSTIENFWKEKRQRQACTEVKRDLPKGTIFADAVKITKKVRGNSYGYQRNKKVLEQS